MLVLGRKEDESIIIGDNIRITVVGRTGATVRIGVQAPKNVRIMRAELLVGEAEETPTSKPKPAGPAVPVDCVEIVTEGASALEPRLPLDTTT